MDLIATQQALAVAGRRFGRRATPTYSPALLTRAYSGLRAAHNWTPDNTRRLRAGLGRAASGGRCSIVTIGDSIFAGCTNGQSTPAEYARLQAIPISMRDALAAKGVPTAGTGLIRGVENTEIDYRWTYGGTWTNQHAYGTGAVGATATLTPDRSGSGVGVWYYGNGGRFTVAVNGATSGAGFADITAPSDGVWRKAVLLPSGIVAGTAALVITVVSGTLITTGSEVFTPNAGLTVHNIAQGGSKAVGTGTSSWSDLSPTGSLLPAYLKVGGQTRTITDGVTAAGTNVVGSASGFNTVTDLGRELVLPYNRHDFPVNTYITGFQDSTHAYMSNNAPASGTGLTMTFGRDPDAVFVELGANDHPVSDTPIVDIIAGLTTIAGQWPNSDVILVLENQENSATLITDADWEAYATALYGLAETLDVPLVDVRHRVGNWSTAVATGVAGDNAGHMRVGAYAAIGKALAELVAA